MKSCRQTSVKLSLIALLLFATCTPSLSNAKVKASFLYNLSDFSGTVPYSWVKQSVDRERDEVYVITGDSVSVYNSSGMEVHRFGEDLELGVLVDVSVESDGNILVLSRTGDKFKLTRCNFRGEPKSEIEIRNLAKEFAEFLPTRLIARNGSIYLADLFAKKIVATGANGDFRKGYDVSPFLLDFERKPGAEMDISGFTVDREGNLYFTVSSIFKVFRLTADGNLSGFGDPGNLPGKFNVVSGVAVDDSGNIFVTDTLRSVVMVFSRDFKFQSQFSQRGLGPGSLIAPKELVIDAKGRLYVSQARKRGISVFRIDYN